MATVYPRLVRKRRQPRDGAPHRLRIAAREVRSTDAACEERVTGEQMAAAEQAHAPRRVPRRMQHLQAHGSSSDLVILAEQPVCGRRGIQETEGRPTRALWRGDGRCIVFVDQERGSGRDQDLSDSAEVVEMTVRQHDRGYGALTDGREQLIRVPSRIDDHKWTFGVVAREEAVRVESAQYKALHSHLAPLPRGPMSGIARRASKTLATPRTALSTFVS